MKRSQIKRRPLADTVLSSLEPEERDYRERDSPGLYFRVKPNGYKSWVLRYKRPNGKWGWLGLGSYPELGGEAARRKARELQELAAEGYDLRETTERTDSRISFEQAAREWLAQQKVEASYNTYRGKASSVNNTLIPALGDKLLSQITRRDCARIQSDLEERGHFETAAKARTNLKMIFSWAFGKGYTEDNPATDMALSARKKPESQPYPHLLEKELPDFLLQLRRSRSTVTMQTAIWLALRTATRPGVVRQAEWGEIDLEAEEWHIPASKMKMSRDYVSPLPRQSVRALRELHPITGHYRYLFPNFHNPHRCISQSAINEAIARAGYGNRLVGHGVRHTAATLLREHGWAKELVDAQLSHKEQGVSGVYNKAQYLERRREMMQWYADHLDQLEGRNS